MTVHRVFFRSLSVLCRDPCAPRLIAFNSHCFSPRLSSTDSGIIQDESKLDSSSSSSSPSSSSTPSSKSYKAAEMMPVPKPLFGKKALMKLRKKTGFSMSQCRKALLKHDLDMEAALKYLRSQLDIEEAAAAAETAALDSDFSTLQEEEDTTASSVDLNVKKKKKPKLKGGVVAARLSKEAALLLEMNCESVTLTRNEEFHRLVDSVANIVFENAHSLVHSTKPKSSGATNVTHERVDGVGVFSKASLSTKDILSLKSGSCNSIDKNAHDKPSSVRALITEGKAKLGEVLSPRRCVIFTARNNQEVPSSLSSCESSSVLTPPAESSSQTSSVTPRSRKPSPSSSSAPPPPPKPRFHFGSYVHPSSARGVNDRPLNGRYGAVVAMAKIGAAINERHFDHFVIGRRLSQHVVGMNPKSIDGGKPRLPLEDKTVMSNTTTTTMEMSDEMESRLMEQPFLSDPSLLIKEYLFINGVKMIDFVRFECGKK